MTTRWAAPRLSSNRYVTSKSPPHGKTGSQPSSSQVSTLSVVKYPVTIQKKITTSPAETQALGQNLATQFRSVYGQQPVIFALRGELGAGKTQFVKGLALGLGITQLITSPSYTLVNEYTFDTNGLKIPFIHLDAWRLLGLTDLESVGWSRFLADNAVIALEWAPDQPASVIPESTPGLLLEFQYRQPENERLIQWQTLDQVIFPTEIQP